MPLKTVFLSLGSNIGDREAHLTSAVRMLPAAGIHIEQCSSIYESEPQDVKNQPWFLNVVLKAETALFPLQLLSAAQRIERELGRLRSGVPRRGPRTMDIDILLFGSATLDTPQLIVPHPRMLERRFVLEPLSDIAPHVSVPGVKGTIAQYLSEVRDQKIKRVGTLQLHA